MAEESKIHVCGKYSEPKMSAEIIPESNDVVSRGNISVSWDSFAATSKISGYTPRTKADIEKDSDVGSELEGCEMYIESCVVENSTENSSIQEEAEEGVTNNEFIKSSETTHNYNDTRWEDRSLQQEFTSFVSSSEDSSTLDESSHGIHSPVSNSIYLNSSIKKNNSQGVKNVESKNCVVGDQLNSDEPVEETSADPDKLYFGSRDKPHVCDVCGKPFQRPGHLASHYLIHTGEKPFKCGICYKTFTKVSNLTRHELRHNDTKTYKCTICEAQCPTSIHLKSHMLLHTDKKSKRLMCDVCFKTYRSLNELARHCLKHEGDEKPHKCEDCGKGFKTRKDLKLHVLIHTGEKPHVCNVCGRQFSQIGNLNTHLFTHTGQKPFKCDICSKVFTRSDNLVRHLLIHTGEKPHKCHLCSKQFATKDMLSRHAVTHKGLTPYSCDICSKSFSSQRGHQVHMLLHTGQKPFSCNICGQRFAQNSSRTSHMLIHTNDRPFKCDMCDIYFKRLCSLNRHLQAAHDGVLPNDNSKKVHPKENPEDPDSQVLDTELSGSLDDAEHSESMVESESDYWELQTEDFDGSEECVENTTENEGMDIKNSDDANKDLYLVNNIASESNPLSHGQNSC